MNREVLDDYLDRSIMVFFHDDQKIPPCEEGILQDFSSSGILLEREDEALLFIPFSSIRMLQIKPKPTLWQKLTGTY